MHNVTSKIRFAGRLSQDLRRNYVGTLTLEEKQAILCFVFSPKVLPKLIDALPSWLHEYENPIRPSLIPKDWDEEMAAMEAVKRDLEARPA